MSDSRNSPSSSIEPTPEPATPAAELEAPVQQATKKRKRMTKADRPFEVQQSTERQYYRRYIAVKIRGEGKWSMKTPEQRLDIIVVKWTELREYRKKMKMDTMEKDFVGEYDEAKELEWLRNNFKRVIEQGRAGASGGADGYSENQDDDEALPTRSVIKSEPAGYWADIQHKTQASASRSSTESTEKLVNDNSKEVTVCELVSSGLVIKPGNVDLSKAKARGKTTTGSEAGYATGKGTKRSWAWINMKLVAWPPFEASQSGSSLKRKLGGNDDAVGQKRLKV